MMKKNLKFIVCFVLMIITEIFLYFQMSFEKMELTWKYKLVFVVLILLINIFIFAFTIYIDKKMNKDITKIKIEKIFLIESIVLGLLYLIFIPAILGTDELPHFLRPYQISVGDVVVKEPELNETLIPSDFVKFVQSGDGYAHRYSKDNIFKSVDYSNMENLWNGDVTSINYSPIPYIPQLLGFYISRLLALSPLLTMYCVRFMNLIVWIALGYFAIKLLPSKKLFALLLYTSPAVLSLVSTCSGDAFALGLFFLIIAYILNLRSTGKNLTKKSYIVLLLLSIGISTFKIFYVLYILLLILIPVKSFGESKKKKIIALCVIFGLSLLLDFGWFILSSGSSLSSETTSQQIQFILSNPLKYVFIFINTYINDVYYYVTNFVAGTEMCYGLARINQLFVMIYLATLIISYFDNTKMPEIKLSHKILVALIILAIFGLVSTTLYLDWTSKRVGIGSTKITGIQSRYFFPLIIPLLLLLPKTKLKFNNYKILVVSGLIMNGFMLLDTIKSLLIYIFP